MGSRWLHCFLIEKKNLNTKTSCTSNRLSIVGLRHIHPVIYMLPEFCEHEVSNFPPRQLYLTLNSSNTGCNSCFSVCFKNLSHQKFYLKLFLVVIAGFGFHHSDKIILVSAQTDWYLTGFGNLGGATNTTNLICHFSTVEPIRAFFSECCLRSQVKNSLGTLF